MPQRKKPVPRAPLMKQGRPRVGFRTRAGVGTTKVMPRGGGRVTGGGGRGGGGGHIIPSRGIIASPNPGMPGPFLRGSKPTVKKRVPPRLRAGPVKGIIGGARPQPVGGGLRVPPLKPTPRTATRKRRPSFRK